MWKVLKHNKNTIGFILSCANILLVNTSLSYSMVHISEYFYLWMLVHAIVILFTYLVHNKLCSPIRYGTHQHLVVFLSTSYILYIFILIPFIPDLPEAFSTIYTHHASQASLWCAYCAIYLHICSLLNIILAPFQSKPSTINKRLQFNQPMTASWYRCLIRWPGEIYYATSLLSIVYLPIIYIIFITNHIFTFQLLYFTVIFAHISIFVYCSCTLCYSLSDDVQNWSHITIEMSHRSQNNMRMQHCDTIRSHQHNNHHHEINDGIIIYQITDTHIDSYWSALQLNRLCQKVVEYNPDLVLLTGDFYYTHNDDICADLLHFALFPLKEISDKCYACLGNHDLKRKRIITCIEDIFSEHKLNIKILRDEITRHKSRIGWIQMIGFDFVFKHDLHRRAQLMQNVMKNKTNERSIVLLHDPFAFDELNGDENVCVFSGHTHGGHIGLWLLNITRFSIYRLLLKQPDIGMFMKGNNKMYVHRGNALWAKSILRVGVPAEYSCIKVCWEDTAKNTGIIN